MFLLIHHKVENFDKWKPVFDEHGKTRQKGGSKGSIIYRSKENPNETVVIMEWDNIENAKKFGSSQDLKDTMAKAGVTGTPDVYFLEQVDKRDA